MSPAGEIPSGKLAPGKIPPETPPIYFVNVLISDFISMGIFVDTRNLLLFNLSFWL